MATYSFPLTSYTRAEAQAPVKGGQPKWGAKRLSPPDLRVVVEEGARDEAALAGGPSKPTFAVLHVLQCRASSRDEIYLDTIRVDDFKLNDGHAGLAARVQGCQLQVRWAVSTSPNLFRRFQLAFPSASECAAFVERVNDWIPTTVLPEPAPAAAAVVSSSEVEKANGKRRKTGAAGPRPRKQPKLGEPARTGAIEESAAALATSKTVSAEGLALPAAGGLASVSVAPPSSFVERQVRNEVLVPGAVVHPPAEVLHAAPAPPIPAARAVAPAVVADLINLNLSPAAWLPTPGGDYQVDPSLFDRPITPPAQALPPPLQPAPPTPLVDLRPLPLPVGSSATIWGALTANPGGPTALEDAALRRLVGDVLADENFLPFVERLERVLGENPVP